MKSFRFVTTAVLLFFAVVVSAHATTESTASAISTKLGPFQFLERRNDRISEMRVMALSGDIGAPWSHDKDEPKNGHCELVDYGYCLDSNDSMYNSCVQYGNPDIQTIVDCNLWALKSPLVRGFYFHYSNDDANSSACALLFDADVDVLEECPFEDPGNEYWGYSTFHGGTGVIGSVIRYPNIACYQCIHD